MLTPPPAVGRGRLIVFCGIDGCGKTTQLRRLQLTIGAHDMRVVLTKQPTDLYRQHPAVRAYLDNGNDQLGMFGMALLAAADRQFHVRTTVAPALAAGDWVLSDRWVYSTYAFFGARGIDHATLASLNVGVPSPDLVVLLDIDPAVARERVRARDGTVVKFEETSLAFMEDVRRRFLDLVDDDALVLDATAGPDQLASAIASRALALLA